MPTISRINRRQSARVVIPMIAILAIACLTGCTQTRSISAYDWQYNPTYRGELSQIAFVRGVSAADAPEDPTVSLRPGQRMIIIQSGQLSPDPVLLAAAEADFEVIPMSGQPSREAAGGTSLRAAAAAGGVDVILAYWGTIREDEARMIVVTISAIIADVESGTWRSVVVHSPPVREAWSFFDARGTQNRQIVELKERVYASLLHRLRTLDQPQPD